MQSTKKKFRFCHFTLMTVLTSLQLTLRFDLSAASKNQMNAENQRNLMGRISAHNFCSDSDEFWLEHSDESLLSASKNTFFLRCFDLEEQWLKCQSVTESVNASGSNKMVELCPYFGTSKGPLLFANVSCRVLPCIECHGARNFMKQMPCKKYTGHYFLSALLYSIFLGPFAVDRFYLGYSAIAVGKLMTLGGLGVWWLADIFLLLYGHLTPADDSEWQPFWQ
ncbi:hypothetical protein GPALN_005209 [Globodera pallida]|nr:hypothetical protein GPALN_005209 [Globodera pallida]